MYYAQSFKNKIGELVSGGKVITGAFNKIVEYTTDSEITKKYKIKPLSIPSFFATVQNLIDTGEMKKTNGNIFYVKATDGRTLTVHALFDGEQWVFFCREFDDCFEFYVGRSVFSSSF